jgi:hypothetical protein
MFIETNKNTSDMSAQQPIARKKKPHPPPSIPPETSRARRVKLIGWEKTHGTVLSKKGVWLTILVDGVSKPIRWKSGLAYVVDLPRPLSPGAANRKACSLDRNHIRAQNMIELGKLLNYTYDSVKQPI